MSENYDIFISYASNDKELADKIGNRMMQAGFSVDSPCEEYTSTTPTKHAEEIANSSMMIYIASRFSNSLRKSSMEIILAAKKCKAVFVVVTDDSSFPSSIPRPSVYQLPTIDFRRQLQLEELIERLASTVLQVTNTGSVYNSGQLEELKAIREKNNEGKRQLKEGDCNSAVVTFREVIRRLELLPAYPPTMLANAYSNLASALYDCQNYRSMYEADERALALIASEDFSASKDINFRLAVAISRMENPSHDQLVEGLSHIEAAIYDHSIVNPDDDNEATEMLHIRNSIAERLAI